MVYKIISQFNDDDFEKKLEKISTLFDFMFTSYALYLGLRDVAKKEEGEILIKKIFKPIKSYYIEPINEKNINRQTDVVKEWCLNKLVALDRQRFEINEQEKLKATWLAMDNMEAELELIKKKGGKR